MSILLFNIVENKSTVLRIDAWIDFIAEPLSVVLAGGYLGIASKAFRRVKQQKKIQKSLSQLFNGLKDFCF